MTQQSAAANAMTGLQGNLSRLAKLQEQLSSGKLVSRPSDSPTAAVEAMQVRTELRATEQYARNAQDGLAWLSITDTALTNAAAQVRRARDLTLQGMSAGAANSSTARQALALEVDNIRAELVGLANTRYLDRPVFGGTTAGSDAYSGAGGYLGDTGRVMRTIGDGGVQVRVDTPADQTFGDGPNGLFAVLEEISAGLRSPTGDLRSSLERLDTATTGLYAQLSDVGARYNRLEQMQKTADDRLLELRSRLSQVEDIDLPQTIMELQLQQTAYQAALAATARVIQPSLVDFLR
ncbi:MAG TPA: flagellin [Pilimelia sp.]|nr:flagellin [Pilimelia sp.]